MGGTQEQQPHVTITVAPCDVHAELKESERYAGTRENNQRKNRAFKALVESLPELMPTDYKWAFDEKRALQITLPPEKATRLDKTREHQLFDMEFGFETVRLT